jgi:predicted nucleic acid-binding protein
MNGGIAKYFLTDVGFSIALYDKRDEHHQKATLTMNKVEKFRILLP